MFRAGLGTAAMRRRCGSAPSSTIELRSRTVPKRIGLRFCSLRLRDEPAPARSRHRLHAAMTLQLVNSIG
jgi:hypothetical protein